MPYNNTAIPPSEEITGSAILPLARVKKTIAADEDIGAVAATAAFVITKATEMFVQYASQKSYDIAKAEAKPKRSLIYTHVANAVARTDNLEFLSDIVPQTTTVRAHKERRRVEQAAAQARKNRPANTNAPSDPKQTTLDGVNAGGVRPTSSGRVDLADQLAPLEDEDGAGPNGRLLNGLNGLNGTVNGLQFRHYAPNGVSNGVVNRNSGMNGHANGVDQEGDVEME